MLHTPLHQISLQSMRGQTFCDAVMFQSVHTKIKPLRLKPGLCLGGDRYARSSPGYKLEQQPGTSLQRPVDEQRCDRHEDGVAQGDATFASAVHQFACAVHKGPCVGHCDHLVAHVITFVKSELVPGANPRASQLPVSVLHS